MSCWYCISIRWNRIDHEVGYQVLHGVRLDWRIEIKPDTDMVLDQCTERIIQLLTYFKLDKAMAKDFIGVAIRQIDVPELPFEDTLSIDAEIIGVR